MKSKEIGIISLTQLPTFFESINLNSLQLNLIKTSAICWRDFGGGNLLLTFLSKNGTPELSDKGRCLSWCSNCPGFMIIMTPYFLHWFVSDWSCCSFMDVDFVKLFEFSFFVETGSLGWILRFAVTLMQQFFLCCLYTIFLLSVWRLYHLLSVFAHYCFSLLKSCHALSTQS